MTNEMTSLELEMEATRKRLSETIDNLVYRASPKTIVSRRVRFIKAYFVDEQTGDPRTDNILKVTGVVAGVVGVFAVIRRVVR